MLIKNSKISKFSLCGRGGSFGKFTRTKSTITLTKKKKKFFVIYYLFTLSFCLSLSSAQSSVLVDLCVRQKLLQLHQHWLNVNKHLNDKLRMLCCLNKVLFKLYLLTHLSSYACS